MGTEKGEEGKYDASSDVIQSTGNSLTVNAYPLPVVYVPSCKDGSICAQQHHFLKEEKNLSLFFNLPVFSSSLNCVK